MSKSRKLRLLLVDDSPVILRLLNDIFSGEKDMEIVGTAKDGKEAVELTKKLRPDVVTMDIRMPNMDGFEATRQIIAECPTPIVIISSNVNEEELNIVFNALKAGALTVIEKPKNVLREGFSQQKKSIVTKVRAMAEIHVIRRPYLAAASKKIPLVTKDHEYEILALGASVGGPVALHYIFSHLPDFFPVPIVVVQHITKGFLPGLVHWLQAESKQTISIAEQDQLLMPNHIYFAPDDRHFLIRHTSHGAQVILEDSVAIDHFKPSITRLFDSLAVAYPKRAMAGLLTGMGKDGADGLLAMHLKACYTFIQSKESSIVFGMPGAAQALNAADAVIDLTDIPFYLTKFFVGDL